MYNATIFSMALWFALLAVCLLNTKLKVLNSAVIVVLLALSLTYIVRNHIYYPYKSGNIFQQTEDISTINSKESIKIHKATHKLLLMTKKQLIASGYKPGDSVLGVSRLNAVLYILDAQAYGGAAWTGPASENTILENLKSTMLKKEYPEFILYRASPEEKIAENGLLKKLVNSGFPLENYSFISEIGKIPFDNKNLYLYTLNLKDTLRDKETEGQRD